MTSVYVAELGFTTQKTSIRAKKIDGLLLEIYGIVLTRFSIQDSLGKCWFFEETFLLTNTNIKRVLKIPFLSLSNANIKFAELKKLI